MATYPLPTLAAQLTSTGVSYPTYADTLASLQASFRLIYGSDIYIEPDSQDGQWLAFLAQLIYDQNQAVEAAYLNMNPDYALGTGLSSLVKINGIARLVATYSTVTLLVSGDIGTVITNGQAADINGNVWNLPATVTIGSTGSVTVTATAAQPGAIAAAPNTVTSIRTPTLGWALVNNAASATPGAPVETDVQLRSRQTKSTSLPAQTVLQGVVASVGALAGVIEVIGYENDTDTTDADGIPEHSIALVVGGGDSTAIATAINLKKTPGTGTFGNTNVTITDLNGLPKVIKFYRPVDNQMKMAVTIKALPGYTSTVGDAIKQALVDYMAALPTGATVIYSRLYFPAQLNGQGAWQTFEVTNLQVATLAGSLGAADIDQLIYQKAVLQTSNITLTVT